MAKILITGGAGFIGSHIAEALCAGMPIVVPDVGGAYDLAKPGCSEVYTAGNGASAADAVERLLAVPKPDIAAACDKAKEEIWTMNGHFDRLFEFYQSLIG